MTKFHRAYAAYLIQKDHYVRARIKWELGLFTSRQMSIIASTASQQSILVLVLYGPSSYPLAFVSPRSATLSTSYSAAEASNIFYLLIASCSTARRSPPYMRGPSPFSNKPENNVKLYVKQCKSAWQTASKNDRKRTDRNPGDDPVSGFAGTSSGFCVTPDRRPKIEKNSRNA